MRVESLGEALRVVMARRGWSGSQLAREVGASQPWVSMVLGARRDPGMRRSAELLAKAGWELQLAPAREDPVKRQQFLLAAPSVVFLPSSPASAYSSPDYLDRLTSRLAHHQSQMGGAPLAREALRHVRRVIPVAESGACPLQAAASRLCRLAALVLHDVRDLLRAEQLARTALRFGRAAGDPVAQVQALETLSLTTAHSPDGRGAEYARRGLAVPGAEDVDRAVLAARLGRSLALSPDGGRDAQHSLEQALELSGGHGPLEVEIVGNAGIGYSTLGLSAQAERHLATAVELTASSPFLRSLYLARQVKTAIRARNPEVAAERMLALAAITPLVDSPRLRIHQRHIIHGTQTWASVPSIRDAREALREEVPQ